MEQHMRNVKALYEDLEVERPSAAPLPTKPERVKRKAIPSRRERRQEARDWAQIEIDGTVSDEPDGLTRQQRRKMAREYLFVREK